MSTAPGDGVPRESFRHRVGCASGQNGSNQRVPGKFNVQLANPLTKSSIAVLSPPTDFWERSSLGTVGGLFSLKHE